MPQNPERVIYIEANTRDEADRRIDTTLNYCERHWDLESNTRTRDGLKNTLNNYHNALTHNDTTLINVARRDNARRDGNHPGQYTATQLPRDTTQHLIVPATSNLTVQKIIDALRNGVDVHAVSTGVTVRGRGETPDTHVQQALRTLCDEAREADHLIEGIPHRGGRPPIGTTVEDGYLRASENYQQVCRVLQHVRDGLSQGEAADELGCTRKTIGNAKERTELYRLE